MQDLRVYAGVAEVGIVPDAMSPLGHYLSAPFKTLQLPLSSHSVYAVAPPAAVKSFNVMQYEVTTGFS
jgi:hypothetical protein